MRTVHEMTLEGIDHDRGVATWLVNDTDSHPLWYQYGASLIHLRGPSKRVKVHATHELLIFAINPDYPLDPRVRLAEQPVQLLEPANFGYQMACEDDETAKIFVRRALDAAPSMDTDFSQWWNDYFGAEWSLRMSDRLGRLRGL